MTLNLLCGWMLYSSVMCKSLSVISSDTNTNYNCYLSILCVNVCLCLYVCICAHTDWSQRCVNRISDGIWETIIELFTCSPWITYICIIALFHTAWASVSLTQQLYQVFIDTSRLLCSSAAADSNTYLSFVLGSSKVFCLEINISKTLEWETSSNIYLSSFLIDCISWTDDCRKSKFAAWAKETPSRLLSKTESIQVMTLHLQRQFHRHIYRQIKGQLLLL